MVYGGDTILQEIRFVSYIEKRLRSCVMFVRIPFRMQVNMMCEGHGDIVTVC